MFILSIDPGSQSIGWALFMAKGKKKSIVDCGTIRPKGEDFIERCQDIQRHFNNNRFGVGTGIEYVLIESPYLGPKSNPSSILKLGMAVGVIMGFFPSCVPALTHPGFVTLRARSASVVLTYCRGTLGAQEAALHPHWVFRT